MKTLYSVALFLLFATKTFATVTLNMSAAHLNDAGGTSMPTTGLVLLVASTNDATFSSPTFDSFVSGDDTVIAKWDLSAWATPGFLLDSTGPLALGSGWNAGDRLQLYWFPTLDLTDTKPDAALIPYGVYRTDTTIDNGDPWTTPADGATITLKFLTTSASGSNPNSAGNASLLVAKSPATVTITGNLNPVYNGSQQTLGATTVPSGLTVNITYNGNPTPPTAAGTYTVVATIDDPNYTGSDADTLVITGKSVTPVIVAADKVYDGNVTATLSSQSVTGMVGTESVSLSVTAASFDTKDVGTGKTVTASGLSLGGADAGNYVLGSATATDTADITGKTAVLAGLTAASKTYDGNAAATISSYGTLAGVVIGDAVTLNTSGAAATFADKAAGHGKTVTVSGLVLTGADASNYSIANQTTTADITAKVLTLTGLAAANKVYDGSTAATVSSYGTLAGVVGGDTVTLNTSAAVAAFANKAVGTGKTVTVSGLALSGADVGNYSIANQTTTADITTKVLTLTGLAAANKVYDGTTTGIISSLGTLTGVALGDNVTLNTSGAVATFVNKTVGNGKTVTLSGLALGGADAGNYSIASHTTTADITAKALTLTGLTASNKTYDGTTSATVNYGTLAGVVLGDTVTLETSGAGATFADKVVGTAKTVTVTGLALSGADVGNYTIADQTTTADITAKALTLTSLTASNKAYDGTTAATVNYGTLTGVVTGDIVTLNTSGAVANFADETVGNGKIVTVGGLALTGTHASNYSIANQTTTADITAKALTLTGLTANNKMYDGTAAATISNLGMLTGVVLGDNVTLNTSGAVATFANKAVGNGKTVTVSGLALNGTDAGNYSIADQTATADITAKGLTVTGLIVSNKEYDGTTLATISSYGTLTGLVIGDNVTLDTASVTAAFADKNVGAGKGVTISGLALGGGDAGNYSLTQPAAVADITAKGATITANDGAKIYGDMASFVGTEFTASGLIGGDDVTSVTLTSAGAPANSDAGSYPIVPSAAQGTGLANYVIAYNHGTLAVGKAMLTATGDDLTRMSGETNPVFTISYSGFVNGDDVEDLDSLPTASTTATITSEPGSYDITLTGGADNNYAFSLVNGTLIITNVTPPEITSITVADGTAVITWSAIAGREYKLQHKDNVSDSDWVDAPSTVVATGPTASAEDLVGNLSQRFYRVRLLPAQAP